MLGRCRTSRNQEGRRASSELLPLRRRVPTGVPWIEIYGAAYSLRYPAASQDAFADRLGACGDGVARSIAGAGLGGGCRQACEALGVESVLAFWRADPGSTSRSPGRVAVSASCGRIGGSVGITPTTTSSKPLRSRPDLGVLDIRVL